MTPAADPAPNPAAVAQFRDHSRRWEAFRYVYPVVSRRSGGVSIGVNLNPDKRCNFDCIYCQVDRTVLPPRAPLDLPRLEAELAAMLETVTSGALWHHPRFETTPDALRHLRDIALSGDGEPTTEPRFDEVIAAIARIRDAQGVAHAPIVLITDSACLHLAPVRRGLSLMDQHGGVVWAKLDAGTEAYYRQVARSAVPFQRVLRNLREAAAARPLVIQALFMRIRGAPAPTEEVDAWIDRLRELEVEGTLAEVHVYTVARETAEPWVTALTDAEVDALVERASRGGLRAEVRGFYAGGAGTGDDMGSPKTADSAR